MTLTPIGDIGNATLSEQQAAGTVLTWSTFADWEAGTNDVTQGYDAAFSDFPTDDLSVLLVGADSRTNTYSTGTNTTGVSHDPDGDGGNGEIINTSDANETVYFRDLSFNVNTSFSTNASGPKGVGYLPSGDGGSGTVWVANDTESSSLYEYDRTGSTLSSYSPASNLFGCATDDTYVYAASSSTVYQVDPSDGSTVNSWSHQSPNEPGLGYAGQYLLVTDPAGDVYVHEKDTGTLVFGPAGFPNASSTTDKGGDLIYAFGDMYFADRGGDQIGKYTTGYPTTESPIHTTTTKSN